MCLWYMEHMNDMLMENPSPVDEHAVHSVSKWLWLLLVFADTQTEHANYGTDTDTTCILFFVLVIGYEQILT